MVSGPPLDDRRLLRGGLDAHGEAVALCQQQAVSPRARQQPSLEVLGQVEGVAHGADGGGVLLEEQLEGGVLKQGATGVAGDGCERCPR